MCELHILYIFLPSFILFFTTLILLLHHAWRAPGTETSHQTNSTQIRTRTATWGRLFWKGGIIFYFFLFSSFFFLPPPFHLVLIPSASNMFVSCRWLEK